jgi:hypothetical protein
LIRKDRYRFSPIGPFRKLAALKQEFYKSIYGICNFAVKGEDI